MAALKYDFHRRLQAHYVPSAGNCAMLSVSALWHLFGILSRQSTALRERVDLPLHRHHTALSNFRPGHLREKCEGKKLKENHCTPKINTRVRNDPVIIQLPAAGNLLLRCFRQFLASICGIKAEARAPVLIASPKMTTTTRTSPHRQIVIVVALRDYYPGTVVACVPKLYSVRRIAEKQIREMRRRRARRARRHFSHTKRRHTPARVPRLMWCLCHGPTAGRTRERVPCACSGSCFCCKL